MTDTTYTLIETLNARVRELEKELSRYQGGVEVEGMVQFAEQFQKTIINVHDQTLPYELLGKAVKVLVLPNE